MNAPDMLTVYESRFARAVETFSREDTRTMRACLKLIAFRYSLRTMGAGMLGTREGAKVESLARSMVNVARREEVSSVFIEVWASIFEESKS